MFGLKNYNYESFTRDLLNEEMSTQSAGPEPGERAPEFEAQTLADKTIRLANYRGWKNVVLTFGSLTCPMTAGSIRGMNELWYKSGRTNVEFLFVYTREAHPGERIPAHKSIEDKINVEHDTRMVGVQTIIVIEDSVNVYFVPYGLCELMQQLMR